MGVAATRFLPIVLIALGGHCVGIRAILAAGRTSPGNSASDLVGEALRQEIQGNDIRRDALLAEALSQAPRSAPALWHTGHVRLRNQWLKFEEVPKLAAENNRLAAYRVARQQYPETVDGQLALARWCERQELIDQQRVHLTKAVELNPNHLEARRRLGYQWVNGMWLTAAEIQQVATNAARNARDLREWIPRLLADRDAFASHNPGRRKAAEKRLLAVRSRGALGAIERVLSTYNEETARLAVRMLANISGHEASAALVRQAVFSPSAMVRNAAIEILRSRPFDSFVPGLLSIMVSPIQTRLELYQDVSGRTIYRHTFYQEAQDAGRLAVFDTEYRPGLVRANENPRDWRERMARARRNDAAAKAQVREMAVAHQNAKVQAFNDRVCTVLAGATGQDLPASPEGWWQWWNSYNEVFVEGDKPVVKLYQRNENHVSRPAPRRSKRKKKDCLAAGTTVWTESGLVAIEEVRAGDLVLSQNVETGELAYKPVFRTTIRPETELIRILAGDQTVHCTGGHPFWVSGTGWVKARDLKPSNHLHCVGGTTSVRSIEASESQTTYNLVIGDFHSYFVGNARILTHDNTVRTPTNTVVPGLLEK